MANLPFLYYYPSAKFICATVAGSPDLIVEPEVVESLLRLNP